MFIFITVLEFDENTKPMMYSVSFSFNIILKELNISKRHMYILTVSKKQRQGSFRSRHLVY